MKSVGNMGLEGREACRGCFPLLPAAEEGLPALPLCILEEVVGFPHFFFFFNSNKGQEGAWGKAGSGRRLFSPRLISAAERLLRQEGRKIIKGLNLE